MRVKHLLKVSLVEVRQHKGGCLNMFPEIYRLLIPTQFRGDRRVLKRYWDELYSLASIEAIALPVFRQDIVERWVENIFV